MATGLLPVPLPRRGGYRHVHLSGFLHPSVRMGWITPYFSPRVQVLSRHILAIAAVFHGHLHPAFIRAASPIDANDRRMKGKPEQGGKLALSLKPELPYRAMIY